VVAGELGGGLKPPAQLARVVAPASHPCERGGATQQLAFVVHRRPQ